VSSRGAPMPFSAAPACRLSLLGWMVGLPPAEDCAYGVLIALDVDRDSVQVQPTAREAQHHPWVCMQHS